MKKLERFLVMLALLSVLLTLYSLKEGLAVAVIALPLLALFYLTCLGPLLKGSNFPKRHLLTTILCGAGLAYNLCSLLFFLLVKIPRTDLLENTSLITVVAGAFCIWRFRHTRNHFYSKILLRYLPLLVVIAGCAAFFKTPH